MSVSPQQLHSARVPVSDRRSSFRYTTNISVLAALIHNGKERKLPNTILKNISTTGAGINSSFTLPIGEVITLHFYLPDYSTPFQATCKVIWSDSLGQCGVKFEHVSPQHLNALHSWLALKAAEEKKLSVPGVVPLGGSLSDF
ncbi:MAG TPA: PilZ domain-containing protein [Candidatus Angelobacter sp.]|nr:PilZ domain-containing protein [Candidatus Angelobacter sp.]